MSIVLKTPSNGSVTLAEEDTASDVVVTIPAGTSTLVTNATLPTQLNASGSAPVYACRAWVNFDGTGTVAIRASGNVTSITDNGTGNYTINFTTAMPDEDYAVVCGASSPTSATSIDTWVNGYVFSTSSIRIEVESATSVAVDRTHVSVIIFR